MQSPRVTAPISPRLRDRAFLAVPFQLGLTHRDLAELVGTRRESVTTALSDLQRAGLVEVESPNLYLGTDGLALLTER